MLRTTYTHLSAPLFSVVFTETMMHAFPSNGINGRQPMAEEIQTDHCIMEGCNQMRLRHETTWVVIADSVSISYVRQKVQNAWRYIWLVDKSIFW